MCFYRGGPWPLQTGYFDIPFQAAFSCVEPVGNHTRISGGNRNPFPFKADLVTLSCDLYFTLRLTICQSAECLDSTNLIICGKLHPGNFALPVHTHRHSRYPELIILLIGSFAGTHQGKKQENFHNRFHWYFFCKGESRKL